MKLGESTILLLTTIVTAIAALFTLIGLTTPKWSRFGRGLWNCKDACPTSTAVLTILALLFLVASVILMIILLIRLFPRNLRILPVVLVIIATLFLLIATASYLRHLQYTGYSFDLVVTAHAFAFIASVALAFGLAQHGMKRQQVLPDPQCHHHELFNSSTIDLLYEYNLSKIN